MDNRIAIIDYTEHGTSIYVKVEVFDAERSTLFAEEVRFLDDLLYGDLLHPKRSPLTAECRQEASEYLRRYFGR